MGAFQIFRFFTLTLFSCLITIDNVSIPSSLFIDKARQYSCDICEKTFTQHSHLLSHMTIHSDSRDHHCRFCDKRFRRRGDRLSHEKEAHYLGRAYECTHEGCDKVFYKLHNLKKHLLTHTGERRFKCDVCDAAFKQKAHLKTHLYKIHERVMEGGGGNKIRQGVT